MVKPKNEPQPSKVSFSEFKSLKSAEDRPLIWKWCLKGWKLGVEDDEDSWGKTALRTWMSSGILYSVWHYCHAVGLSNGSKVGWLSFPDCWWLVTSALSVRKTKPSSASCNWKRTIILFFFKSVVPFRDWLYLGCHLLSLLPQQSSFANSVVFFLHNVSVLELWQCNRSFSSHEFI